MFLYHVHITKTGEISCYPKAAPFIGNILNVDDGPIATSCLDGRVRANPDVHKGLVELLTISSQWVLDYICSEGVYSATYT